MEAAETAVCLVMKSVLLSGRWAGRTRRLGLEQAARAADDGAQMQADNVMLRDTIEFLLERLACAQRRLQAAHLRKPYSLREQLHILWCVEYFGIPRRQIPKHFGVARSTVWRWLRRIQDGIGVAKALEQAFLHHGAPKHLITDQEKVFTGEVFGDLLWRWHVKQRFGAVGKHGSIAVTERVIRTLKYEWLKRVPVIRGLDHLELLLADFACYYNCWRPHTNLKGAVPDVIHAAREWSTPARTAKAVPAHIERRFFPETRITAYRLANAA